jgi:hypothetical protein
MAPRTIDRVRLLYYLSARAGEEWGLLELIGETTAATPAIGASGRVLIYRNRETGALDQVLYPLCLDKALEPMLLAEYKRIATEGPLSLMSEATFESLYAEEMCGQCRWRREGFAQFHLECRFAGRPINFEPME